MYSEGSVRVVVGSSLVKGTGTQFVTYAAQGYLFRLTGEAVYYEVSSITNATNLTLSANYANSGYGVGSPLNNMPYVVVTDYTPNYSLPEMAPTDSGITFVYTKAMREIDSLMYNASSYSVKSASDIEVTASLRGVVLHAQDGTAWRLTVSNLGTVLTATV